MTRSREPVSSALRVLLPSGGANSRRSRDRCGRPGVDLYLFRPEVREALRRLIAEGWMDAVRKLHPGQRIYTFWKYYRGALNGMPGFASIICC